MKCLYLDKLISVQSSYYLWSKFVASWALAVSWINTTNIHLSTGSSFFFLLSWRQKSTRSTGHFLYCALLQCISSVIAQNHNTYCLFCDYIFLVFLYLFSSVYVLSCASSNDKEVDFFASGAYCQPLQTSCTIFPLVCLFVFMWSVLYEAKGGSWCNWVYDWHLTSMPPVSHWRNCNGQIDSYKLLCEL